MKNWEKLVLTDYGTGEGELSYFIRKMMRSEACTQEYASHVFLKFFANEKELKNEWKQINEYIAVRVQSKIKALIEKSNFYLCFFVEGEVSLSIQEIIEGDSFCAKKYVFTQKKGSLEECCIEVENRIFSINIDKSIFPAVRLTGIELQNFRAYEGKVGFDFQNKYRQAASFVAIYAKNGVGKTSLFDGVEFALKGAIGRLEDLKEKGEGAIFHNRKHSYEEAYVKLLLNNGSWVQRNISKVAEGGNDCRHNAPVAGKELVGEPGQWNQTILPHDRIDTFISAKKPTDRYKEWVQSTELFKEQDSDFITAHKKVKAAEKELIDVIAKVSELEKKLIELKKQEGVADNWKKLIEEYNEGNQNRLLKLDENSVDEQNYDRIKNFAQQYIRDIEKNVLESLRNNIKCGEKVLRTGVDAYRERFDKISAREETLRVRERAIERRQEYDRIFNRITEKEQKIAEIKQELIPIEKIEFYGKKIILQEKKLYEDRLKEIHRLQIVQDFTVEEKKELQEKIRKLKSSILEQEEKIEKEVQQSKLKKLRVEYDSNERQIEERKKRQEQFKEELTKLLVQEQELEKSLQIFKNINLPEKMQELSVEKIPDLQLLLGVEEILELKKLEEHYEEILKSRNHFQKQLLENQKNQAELAELCDKGRSYLNKHQDITSCPLCHTPFNKWEMLFQKVNSTQEGNEEFIQGEIKLIGNNISRTEEEYIQFIQKFETGKKVTVAEKKVELDNLKENQKKLQDKEIVEKKQFELQLIRQAYVKNLLQEEGVPLTGKADEAFEYWIAALREKILEETEEIKKYEDRQIELLDGENRLKYLRLAQKDVLENQELYPNIKFLLEKSNDFNLEKEKERLNKEKKDFQEETERLKEFFDEYQDVSEGKIQFYIDARNTEKMLLEKDYEMKAECSIFPIFTEEKVMGALREWRELCDREKNNVELLQRICEENGAREYFEKYKLYKAKIEKQNQIERDKKQDKETLLKRFEIKKQVLEDNLRAYFSQTMINEIYRKIDPHQIMKNVDYKLSFNDKDEPQLTILVSESMVKENQDFYRPEWFFSSAQLNTVAFSSFFSRALQAEKLPIGSIFIDDPIGHFDDINILGFADLIRSVLEFCNCQIVISTHDEKVFRILERKLNDEYYNSCFIRLPEDCATLIESDNK